MKVRNLILGLLVSSWIPAFASVKLVQVAGMAPSLSLRQCSALETGLGIAEANKDNPDFTNESKGVLELFQNMEGATAQLVFQFENEKYPIQFIRKNAGPVFLPAILSLRIPGAREGSIMNGTYSAQVVLSLAGACPFYDKNKQALRKPISVQEWEQNFELVRFEGN